MQTIRQDSRGRKKTLPAPGRPAKRGVTLVELLAVIAIMGILSGIGVAGLQSAVANARARGEAESLSAFFQNASSIAKQRSDSLCIAINSNSLELREYDSSQNKCSGATVIQRISLEAGSSFSNPGNTTTLGAAAGGFSGNPANWKTTVPVIAPRLGLNALSSEGYLALNIVGGRQAAIVKTQSKNYFQAFVSYDEGASWITHR